MQGFRRLAHAYFINKNVLELRTQSRNTNRIQQQEGREGDTYD